MSTSASAISAILGKYMLTGWTLTDINCPRQDCSGCPLMRSHDRRIQFCARCDGGPPSADSALETEAAQSASSGPHAQAAAEPTPPSSPASPSADAIVSLSDATPANSRSSTPPSSHSGLPEEDDFVPIASPRTISLRRAQSDRASALIGQLLLKAWILLDAQCPGEGCWGVPLMKSPRRPGATQEGGHKGRWCVICETDWDNLMPRVAQPEAAHPTEEAEERKLDVQQETTVAAMAVGAYASTSNSRPRTAKAPITLLQSPKKRPADEPLPRPNRAHAAGADALLAPAIPALGGAIKALSSHVEALTGAAGGVVDPEAIAKAAEALGRVVKVYREL